MSRTKHQKNFIRTTGSSNPKERREWKDKLHQQAIRERFEVYGKLEPLTDTLIDELLGRGFKHAHLLAVKQSGYLYSRKINSFVRDMDHPKAIAELFKS